jgi:hypothetical protein
LKLKYREEKANEISLQKRTFQEIKKENENFSDQQVFQIMRKEYDLPETTDIQIHLDVKASLFKVGENTEVYFSLYSRQLDKFITEEYMVELTIHGKFMK